MSAINTDSSVCVTSQVASSSAAHSTPSILERKPIPFKVFIFIPPKTLATSLWTSLEGKVIYLQNAIREAAKMNESDDQQSVYRSVFVGPEDIFHIEAFEYSTELEKKSFKTSMIELSKTVNMIIVPGTFNWMCERNGVKKFHKTAYLFDQTGRCRRYNKQNFFPDSETGILGDPLFGKEHSDLEFATGKKALCTKRQESP